MTSPKKPGSKRGAKPKREPIQPAVLQTSQLQAVVDPEHGASILALFVRKGPEWLPLMPDVRLPGSDLKASSFLMIPYSNRIADGQFNFGGHAYQLLNGEKHAIHGDVRDRHWEVDLLSMTRIRCTFFSADHKNINWPWPFEVHAEYEVRENLFSARLTLWNRGDSAMPAGLGWHPYFNRQLGNEPEDVYLQAHINGIYPDANDNRLPSGPPEPPSAARDFSEEKAIKSDDFFDICCTGYSGGGHIRWQKSGVTAAFYCTPECTHLVAYNPTSKPYFAVEPVTNANNGVNLFDQAEMNSGVQILLPDESLEAEMNLFVEVR